MKSIRPYQDKIINDAREKLRVLSGTVRHRKPRLIMQLSPGGGKTFTAATMAKSALDKGGTVVFLCHRDFLMEQTSETFNDLGIDHSFLAAGKWLNPWKKCHIGMIGSMKTRQSRIKAPTLAFIDECHHIVAKTWQSIIDAWPDTTFIGLSGTPSMRSDGIGLSAIADDIVHGPSVRELIDMGALSEYEYYAPTEPDLSKVHTRMGEYVQGEVDVEMSKSVIIGDIVQSYKKHANGTLAVYFAPSVETSRRYAMAFNDAGIPASHIDANTPKHERKQIILDAASGKIKVLCNYSILCEGFDLGAIAPGITVETVGLCRPTKSFPLLVQMAMRSMRAKSHPGIILDHAGSYKEHNWLPDDDIEWDISGSPRERPTIGIIQCQGCGAALKRGSLSCGHCGSVNEPLSIRGEQTRNSLQHVDGELAIISREEAAIKKAEAIAERKSEQGQARTYEELVELAKRRGYKNPRGWAKHIYSARMSRG